MEGPQVRAQRHLPLRRASWGDHRISATAFAVGCLFVLVGCVDDGKPERLPTEQDAIALMRLMADSQRVIEGLESDATFGRESKTEPLSPDERDRTLPLFATLIDHDLAFLSYRSLFLDAWRVARDKKHKVYVLAVGLGAHAAQLRARLKLVSLIGGNVAIRVGLNDASPEHGFAAGHLDRMMIEAARPDAIMLLDAASETLRELKGAIAKKPDFKKVNRDKVWQALKKKSDFEKRGEAIPSQLEAQLEDIDLETVIATLLPDIEKFSESVADSYAKVSGKLLSNTVSTMVDNELQGVLSPIVTDIALWLGDTRLRASGKHLITTELLDSIQPMLKGGDVILERRNWYLSNLGLPGFWPHAALYLGNPTELKAEFDADPDVLTRFPGGLSAHLQKTYPEAWAAYQEDHGDGPMRVIEAVSEGVIFTSLYHSCLADYVAFLRPRLRKVERAVAISQAFSHWSKPYDFDFDFQTTSTLVCSELVYTSYRLPSADGKSLNFDPLPEVMGRLTLPPNDIIQGFDERYGTADQQFDFVVFLDGVESTQSAIKADVDALRASWKRPKWDLSQQ